MGDKTDAGLILVWGQTGQKLTARDSERILAIAQKDPDYFLAIKANKEHMAIVDMLKEPEYIENPDYDEKDISKKYIKNPEFNFNSVKVSIVKVSENDNLFREVADFLHDADDMLSTGSFLTGELKNKHAKLLLTGGDSDDV